MDFLSISRILKIHRVNAGRQGMMREMPIGGDGPEKLSHRRYCSWKTMFILVVAIVLCYVLARRYMSSHCTANTNQGHTALSAGRLEQPLDLGVFFRRDAEQEQRQHTLRVFCNKWSNLKYWRADFMLSPNRKALVIPDLQLFMCQSAKTGSTFWREYLSVKYQGIFTEQASNDLLEEARANFLKVLYVRHPLYRLYSAYNDRIVRMAGVYGKIKEAGEKIYTFFRDGLPVPNLLCYDGITFEEYVRLATREVRSGHGAWMDYHRRPFYLRCQPCMYTYDIIGKLETASTDVPMIFKALEARGINISSEIGALNGVSIYDKCRWFSPPPPGSKIINNNCSSDERVLSGNIKALYNQGFTSEHGFTYKTFLDTPRLQWYRKCQELIQNVLDDPVQRHLVSVSARETAKRALQSLPLKVLDEVIEAYLPDFRMFGYSTDEF